MKNKLVAFIVGAGVLFQFGITGFVCYMVHLIYIKEAIVNEMMVGSLIGLMTGIGLSASVSYLLSIGDKEKQV